MQLCASWYSALAYCTRTVILCANKGHNVDGHVFSFASVTDQDRLYLAVDKSVRLLYDAESNPKSAAHVDDIVKHLMFCCLENQLDALEATESPLQEPTHHRGSHRALLSAQTQRQPIRPDLHRRSFSKYGTEAAGLVRRSASVFANSLRAGLFALIVAACGVLVAYCDIVFGFFRLVRKY